MDFLQSYNNSRQSITAAAILSQPHISLTEKEAYELAAVEEKAYAENGRVFFGESALPAMISTFSQSSYLPHEQAEFFAELTDIFIYMKNSSHDNLTDMEAIAKMYALWEQKSGGSLEMLRSLEEEL